MLNTVDNVKTNILIYFANGEQYELPLVNANVMTEDLDTYGTSIKLNEQLYNSSSDNIVGNVCGNTLNIELVSNDMLLIPNNTESEYYGYMNDTAYIDISVYIPAEDKTVELGRYYVDTWESGAQANKAKEVSISCVNLMSKIKNMSLNKVRLYRNMKFNDYLKIIIDNLNSRLPEHMQILYTDEDLKIFRNSSYDWQMYFNNIDRTDVETLFNSIAKYTVSYIWIGRDRHIKTDHLLDDSASESVSEISGAVNLYEYTNQSGDIDKYSGIRVKYIENISYEDKQLLNISDIQLYKGNNTLEDQRLNSDKVADIHTIEIVCDTGKAFCISFDNYKNSMNMIIRATNTCKATIKVYGKVINETYGTLEKYIDTNNKNTMLEIENRVLIKELINTYSTGLINLMSMKNNKIQANGYINPGVELGNTIRFTGKRFNIDDFYKVVGMDFTLGRTYRCNITLLKTISTNTDVNDILYNYNALLYRRLSGDNVDSTEYRDLTESENEIAYEYLQEELEEFNSLVGGV